MYGSFVIVDGEIKYKQTNTKANLHFKKYEDPGHGWLAVKRSVLEQHGILDKISTYSYQNGGTVYLEEDCDMSVLIDTLVKNNVYFTYETKYQENTPIRSYGSFTK